MSDNVTGEVTFTAQNKAWSLRFTINAICRAEQVLGMGIGQAAAELMRGGRLGHIRTMIWAALVDQHPKLTEVQVGDLIDEIGIETAGEYVDSAFRIAFPAAFKTEGGDNDDPR